jgi:hypothetical protein
MNELTDLVNQIRDNNPGNYDTKQFDILSQHITALEKLPTINKKYFIVFIHPRYENKIRDRRATTKSATDVAITEKLSTVTSADVPTQKNR